MQKSEETMVILAAPRVRGLYEVLNEVRERRMLSHEDLEYVASTNADFAAWAMRVLREGRTNIAHETIDALWGLIRPHHEKMTQAA